MGGIKRQKVGKGRERGKREEVWVLFRTERKATWIEGTDGYRKQREIERK